MKARYTVWVLVGAMALAVSGGVFAADSIQKEFTVSGAGLLKVESEVSSIEVESWARQEVAIEIDLHSWDRADFEKAFEVQFHQSGNDVTLTIESKQKLSSWWNLFSRGFHRGFVVRATVPSVFDVDLKTSGGSVSVADLTGRARAATSGGNLSFGEIRGPVTGRTSGGSVGVDACRGDVDVTTSGGSIHLGQVDGRVVAATSGGSIEIAGADGSVSASTSGGGITVGGIKGALKAATSGGGVSATLLEQPAGDCELETSGGSIRVQLASALHFDLDAKTSGGRVKTEFPVTVSGTFAQGELRGPLNGGGPLLKLRTSGGNITIDKD